jgi:hypothetical protein
VQELPEDGTVVPKHAGVIEDYILLCMLYVHLVGLVQENKTENVHIT